MTSYSVGKGEVRIHPLVNENDTDYKKLIEIAEFFAMKGETVTLTPKMSRRGDFRYEQIYGDLIGTKYEGKCPDLKVGDKWYEHEGYISENPKNAFRNMLHDGLAQSSHLVIDTPNLTDHYMIRSIRGKIERGERIEEVWLKDRDGKLRLLYKNTNG
ncbi:MAG: hypothetical protein IJJ77_03225 [Paludibacteraceae bacterium]|nr:hypothetical protein [Paludibacteraceae bacterium]